MSNKNVDTLLPRDGDDYPIQVLSPSTITNVALVASSTATALPQGAHIVEIGVSQDAWIAFGGSGSVVSSSTGMFMPKGSVVYRVPTDATHLIHIAASTSGRISITKLV